MKTEITEKRTESFEKDYGDEDGRPLIGEIHFRHWTVTSDEDMRPHLEEKSISWYNCRTRVTKESPLEESLAGHLGGRFPLLSGVRRVSDDGREIEFCWR